MIIEHYLICNSCRNKETLHDCQYYNYHDYHLDLMVLMNKIYFIVQSTTKSETNLVYKIMNI